MLQPSGIGSCVISFSRKTPGRLIFFHEEYGNILCTGCDLFESLCQLRLLLEQQKHFILCNGARIDAWASNLARDMGGGKKVYITEIGKLAKFADLVPTLGKASIEKVGTVRGQLEYHSCWMESIMNQMSSQITEDLLKEACLHPNGWVYKIDGDFDPSQDVPFEAIIGWWKVDSQGQIIGPFSSNPKYKPGNQQNTKM
jgi:hypothetical protein